MLLLKKELAVKVADINGIQVDLGSNKQHISHSVTQGYNSDDTRGREGNDGGERKVSVITEMNGRRITFPLNCIGMYRYTPLT